MVEIENKKPEEETVESKENENTVEKIDDKK